MGAASKPPSCRGPHAGQKARILSANAAATAMFGWEASDLVGQHSAYCSRKARLRSENAHASPPQADDGTPGLSSLRVTACRKNGTEFVASIGMLQWRSDTTLIQKTDSAPSPWTAVFRDPADDAEGQSASVPGHDVSITQPGEAFEKLAQENENLKAQIIAVEAELSQVRKLPEQESEARQQLDEKVQSLTASHEIYSGNWRRSVTANGAAKCFRPTAGPIESLR